MLEADSLQALHRRGRVTGELAERVGGGPQGIDRDPAGLEREPPSHRTAARS